MSDNGLLTIKEAATVARVNISTLYKAIQTGRIQVETIPIRGRIIKKIKKIELERVYGDLPMEANGSESKIPITSNRSDSHPMEANGSESIPLETIKIAVKEVIEAERSQLMKPLEEHALYRLGGLEKENHFLKVKVETLLQEIEQYKALPWQIQERDEEIKDLEARHQLEKEEILREYEAKLLEAEEEKIKTEEALKEKLKALPGPVESIKQVLMENAHNLNVLQNQKEELLEKLRRQKQEKEEALKELEARQQQEKSVLETRLKAETQEAQKQKEEIEANLKDREAEEKARVIAQAEKEKAELEARLKAQFEEEKAKIKAEAEEAQKIIVEAWKKELELAKKPWWKLW